MTEALLTDFVNMAEAENYRCCAPFAGAAHVLSIGAQELFPCRHRLCGPCFRIASLGGANQFRCPEPQCRQQVRTAVPVAERSVPELARLRVRCPIDGCRWEGPYGSLGSEFTSHKRRCQRAWTCPECRNWMPSSRQRSHGATCPDQLIQCGYIGCQVQTRRGESDHHNKICDLRPATCEFAVVGCTAMLNHRELTEHMAAPEVQARHSDLLRRATEIAQRVAVVAQPVAEEQLPRFQVKICPVNRGSRSINSLQVLNPHLTRAIQSSTKVTCAK